ncbi:MAG TPA: primosomal protein N' [Candidatus Saccharimonadales bacterium]|nr:primosomal protein N' [Candidatus Saccharimonadales bacterium]
MFYEVLIASQQYHKAEPLTYSSAEKLTVGTVVEVELQKKLTLGIILKSTAQPKFRTKPISRIICVGAINSPSINLIGWLNQYYPSPSGLITSLFAPSYLQTKSKSDELLMAQEPASVKLPKLTPDQTSALKVIASSPKRSVLLHGDTGVGKTRIYLELAKKSLASNQSVIMLTPEIGLTSQLANSFKEVFSNRVYILHSGLSSKQRQQIWLKLASLDQPAVVIGPRSALFSPLNQIGLIVVDEFHDNAYKQEQAPYYLTSRVAGKLAELHQAKLILGSATPPIADYFIFKQNQLPIITMTELAIKTDHKQLVQIVDLKQRDQFSRSQWLSDQLLETTQTALKQGEQVLLFLNRRGTARVVLCSQCGWQALCPRCDLPLTYHGDSHQMICHTCGHTEPTLSNCPVCNSTDIVFKQAGTKTIVDELKRLFPKARVKRFDSDLKKSERLETNYQSVIDGEVDILVGTQMLGKGLDLPKLSVVGVVLADTSLNFPDYTAAERTYQMLNQVIGRVGRGHRGANIIVQTYHPNSALIGQALTKNYQAFYADQIKERQLFNFPPFCYLLKISASRSTQTRAKTAIQDLLDSLSTNKSVEIIGPSPAFSEKARGRYTWQLIVKTSRRHHLTAIITNLPTNLSYDIDPIHLL